MKELSAFALIVALALIVYLAHGSLAWVAFGLIVVIALTPPTRQRP